MVVGEGRCRPGDLSTMWVVQLDCNAHGDTLHGVQPVIYINAGSELVRTSLASRTERMVFTYSADFCVCNSCDVDPTVVSGKSLKIRWRSVTVSAASIFASQSGLSAACTRRSDFHSLNSH